jgi:Ala-tRNA(Pro) deacylase
MAVLPACTRVDVNALQVLSAEEIRLAREPEFQDLFPDSDVGAMPPFGNLNTLRSSWLRRESASTKTRFRR